MRSGRSLSGLMFTNKTVICSKTEKQNRIYDVTVKTQGAEVVYLE